MKIEIKQSENKEITTLVVNETSLIQIVEWKHSFPIKESRNFEVSELFDNGTTSKRVWYKTMESAFIGACKQVYEKIKDEL